MRQTRGWDQEEMAHMSGVSVRTIQRVESGEACSLDTIKGLAAALELNHFSKLMPEPKETLDYKASDLLKTSFHYLCYRNLTSAINLTISFFGVIALVFLLGISNVEPTYDGESSITLSSSVNEDRDFIVEDLTEYEHLEPDQDKKITVKKEEWVNIENSIWSLFILGLWITSFINGFRLGRTHEFKVLIIDKLNKKFKS